ncbi:type I DNA topoisomerase, partial [Patescibacteria group bacterium]|nr:type I DNA topoisomerase [Patescibacteria group bacterium]
MKNLLIVESPTKANTISRYLSKDFDVIATKGHLEDLPKSKLGIDIDNDFNPEYVLLKDRKKILQELKKAVSKTDNIYIATDPDREGEAIGWHTLNLLKIKDSGSVKRIVFHEVTKDAILNAIKNAGILNMNLVDAQQARRVLDRVVGYKLSPLLWTKIRYGLSAGRVQSVALKFIVERERERESFVTEEYWSIDVIFNINNIPIEFSLSKINGKSIKIINAEQSSKISNEIKEGKHTVFDVNKYLLVKKPTSPYTTSSLQQDANNKLGFSSKKTMMLAQRLYEGIKINGENTGLITYMRTDSTNLSTDAISKIRNYISSNFEKRYLPDRPNIYKTKSKLAQEAHEAIRPSYMDKSPERIKEIVEPSLYKLYKLIWDRAIASQMSDAIYNNLKISIESIYKNNKYLLTSTISTVEFDGFKKLLNTSDKDESVNIDIRSLSDIKDVLLKDVIETQHFTEPPARYNDASLVKEMEKSGIGRPSTYASIISTLISRGYIVREKRYFYPTDVGFVVNDFLSKYFPEIVNTEFTSNMEDKLDSVAKGTIVWKKLIKDFYFPFLHSGP